MKKVRLSEKFTPHFLEVWRTVKAAQHLKYVLKGGRGSAKSTHIAMWIILLMMMMPITFLVIRRVYNTVEQSVFEQLKEAIDMLEVGHLWKVSKSPLRLTYIPRGNSIIFRGGDDVQKIKSIKASKFPVAGMWIEELAEFKTEEEVSVIEKSVLRAELPPGCRYIFFYSYNPPKRKQSWVNKVFNSSFLPANTFVDHSTYLQNPFLSKAFIEEAEEVKRRNELKYRHEYLGEALGSGVVPFENLKIEEGIIKDEDVARFDNIRQGLDFGYGPDPLAFVRWHYDKRRNTIYAIDELVDHKVSLKRTADFILKNRYDYARIIADSSEPRSIDTLKLELRIPGIEGAKKGPDSVEFGERWLDELDAIVIDPLRTPNIAREFENIDYQTDKNGDPIPRLEDKDNHTIDATRYAFERDMKKGGVSLW
ncbi:terminase large subunit [Bacillus phage 000TH010]|uniref:Terminase, large subunit n=1 Tax=Bacillus phage 000TH010 TaxID=2601652 RepID=A0A5P8PHT9_9CAUD|nr:terminase large subunit [Bacillus phage 000TH010]QFR56215.1 terminase large subunit [Bacillus phage 000TH010]